MNKKVRGKIIKGKSELEREKWMKEFRLLQDANKTILMRLIRKRKIKSIFGNE